MGGSIEHLSLWCRMPQAPWLPPTIDAANLASKLPEKLRWAGGAALESLKQLTGIGTGDPNSVMGVAAPLTTIGPKAIPLFNHADYLRKVAGESLEDLGYFNRSRLSGLETLSDAALRERDLVPIQRLSNAMQDPKLGWSVEKATNYPGSIRKYMDDFHDPQTVPNIIQALADAYHTK